MQFYYTVTYIINFYTTVKICDNSRSRSKRDEKKSRKSGEIFR